MAQGIFYCILYKQSTKCRPVGNGSSKISNLISATLTQAMSMRDELLRKSKDMLPLYDRMKCDIIFLMSREA